MLIKMLLPITIIFVLAFAFAGCGTLYHDAEQGVMILSEKGRSFAMSLMDIIKFIVELATLVALIVYVIKTWHIASATKDSAEATETSAEISKNILTEMKETRDQEVAPYVVAFFDVSPNKPWIYLVVKNIGKSLAENVKLEFDPLLVNSSKEIKISDMPFIKNGIGSMPPGFGIRTFFDTAISYFDDKKVLPLAYKVKISYSGGIESKARQIEHILDLSAIEGLIYIAKKDMDDLVKKVDTLTQHTDSIGKNLNRISNRLTDGIWIKNPEILITNLQQDTDGWESTASAKLEEFRTLWTSFYGGKRDKLLDPFLSNLQTMSKILGSQILAICSKELSNASPDLISKLNEIAVKLSELGRIRFLMDGGISIDKFDKMGNEIVSLINEAFPEKSKSAES